MKLFWHKRKHFERIVLGLVILLGMLLRLGKMGVYPPGFSWDEAAITYDAWGISLDGHDSWGNFLPLSFKSFGDYKAPLFIYTVALIDKLIGMHYLTVRYVSAIAGVGLIWLTHLITRLLSNKKHVDWLATMFVAFSPEAIHVSRVGFEANVAVLLLALAVYGFLRSRQQTRYWWVCIGTSVLAMYTYQSMKIVVPLGMIALFVWGKKQWLTRKQMLWGFVGLIGLSLPLIMTFREQVGRGTQTLLFFNNDRLSISFRTFYILFRNIWLNMSPSFWILGAGNNWRNHVSYWGMVTPLAWIGMGIGLYYGWRQKNNMVKFLLTLIAINLIPSIISVDSPHYLRALGVLPYAQILGAYGIMELLQTQKRVQLRKLGSVVVGSLILGTTLIFVAIYTHAYVQTAAQAFQYGYQEAMTVVKRNKPTVQHLYITDTLGQAYIFYLLYTGITPAEFASGATANVTFGPIGMPLTHANSLYVGTPSEIPTQTPGIIRTILYPAQTKVALVIAKTP